MSDLRERLERARELAPLPNDPFRRLLQRRDRRRRNHRIAAGTVGLALATGLAGALWVVARGSEPAILPGSGEETTPTAAPGATEVGLDLALDPGEYYYQRVVVIPPEGRIEEETWWALDGSGRRRVTGYAPNWGGGPEGTFGPGEFRVEGDLSDLSADPEAFAAALRDRSGPEGASPQAPRTPDPGGDPFSGELWHAVERLVELPHFTADLRAALFVVVTGLPGAEVTKDVVDPVGRPAVLVSVTFGNERVVRLYFDPDTGQVLARDRDWGGASNVYEIWVSSGIVPSTEDVPNADEALIPEPAQPLPES
jgi:hypothetical protein